MGSPIYDFLLDSFLFDKDRIEGGFRGESEAELERELDRYRQFCIDHTPGMEQEIHRSPSLLRMVAPRGGVPLRLLKQASLYVQQFVIDDPLFEAGYRQSESSRAMSKFAGISDHSLDRERVVSAISQLKEITPMVVGDYVRVLPISHRFEAPEKLPLYVGDGGASASELVRWLRPRARVLAVEKQDGNLIIHPPKPDLAPRDQIAVELDGAEDSFMGFVYSSMGIDSDHADFDPNSSTLPIEIRRERPSREAFRAWVDQSISRAADVFQKQVLDEARVAAALRASQIVRSPLAFELLERVYGSAPHLQSNVAANLIKMELPFLEQLNVREIMLVRREHADAFESWRIELERQLRSLASLQDESTIATKAQEVAHELGVVQIQNLKTELRSLQEKSIFQPAMLGFATLAVSALLGNPLITAAGALSTLGVATKATIEKRAARRKHPAFFLWEVMSRSRKR